MLHPPSASDTVTASSGKECARTAVLEPRENAMTPNRRRFLALAGSAVAAPALLREGYAQAPQVTMRMHHFLPPVSNGHAKFLAPWARKVEADSQGRIK